jgi:Zn-dependent protease with chaperone function
MTEPEIRARLYDGETSAAVLALLKFIRTDGQAYLAIGMDDSDVLIALSDVAVGDRVGNIPRRLQLADGRSLEVLDNSAFDLALQEFGSTGAEPFIRRLEKHWRYAAIAVLVIIVGTVGFVRYGAPMLAERALQFIPPTLDSAIGVDSLAVLDQTVFKPSTLKSDRQAQLHDIFAEVSAGASADSTHFRLELRGGGAIKANAIALPSGIVVLTDELEHLAVNDNEIRGVFSHEVGHLVHRHAMRRLLQSSSAALLLGGIFGDVTGVSTLVTAVPTVLVDSAYSRNFEREADEFAFRWMSQHNVNPAELGNLLTRVTKAEGETGGGYLASHPSLVERVKAAEASKSAAGSAQ